MSSDVVFMRPLQGNGATDWVSPHVTTEALAVVLTNTQEVVSLLSLVIPFPKRSFVRRMYNVPSETEAEPGKVQGNLQ